ncbi:MAG: hypothetical protein A2219_01710 [Elusimicrobia bacterium RIFOXYA2_FULL_50_26]|nr:MAG: hypothetical protein A2219_01710 [Elusimicrobia bacterium RIFOXYA2_FULL_50_26]
MRVAMIIARFYPVQSGSEIQCRTLSGSLIKNNIETFVLTQRLPQQTPLQQIGGIRVHRVGLPLLNKVGSFFFIIYGILWLLRRRGKFEILHANLASSPAILAAMAAKLTGKPAILKIGGSRGSGDVATSVATWYGKLKLAFIRKNISAFVCPSNEIKDELLREKFPANKIVVIPNCVDTARFTPCESNCKILIRQKFGLPQDAVIINYTGRFEPGKGVETLLESWRRFEKNNPTARHLLIIVGSGSLESHLKTQSAGLRCVRFMGQQEATADLFRASDVFVLPSFGEGLSGALLEAMACGLACIVTRIGGNIDVVTDGRTGILYEPGKPDELCAAIERMIGDQSLRRQLGQNARSFAEQKTSVENITQRYMELYKNVWNLRLV